MSLHRGLVQAAARAARHFDLASSPVPRQVLARGFSEASVTASARADSAGAAAGTGSRAQASSSKTAASSSPSPSPKSTSTSTSGRARKDVAGPLSGMATATATASVESGLRHIVAGMTAKACDPVQEQLDAQALEGLLRVATKFGWHFNDKGILLQVVTHKSYLHGGVPTNERLQYLGRNVLETLGVREILKEPKVTEEFIAESMEVNFGNKRLAKVCVNLGLADFIRWQPDLVNKPTAGLTTVRAKTILALIAAIYQEHGPKQVARFLDSHVPIIALDPPRSQPSPTLEETKIN